MAYNRLTGQDDLPDPATDEERSVAEAAADINQKVVHLEAKLSQIRKLWFGFVALSLIGLIALAYKYEWMTTDSQNVPSATSENGR